MKRYCSVLLASGAVASGGLGCAGSDAPLTGDNGQSVTIAVAPLDGSGIGVACFDVQVATALGTLWEKGDPNLSYLEDDLDTVCSDDHGNGGNGGMRWVGTCDAQANADTDGIKPGTQNTVTIWFDGIYNTGKTAETEGVYDPCGDTGCALDFTCEANTDTPVDFNFTVIRDAEVGFFDIGVRFDSIYCSSKYDDCYAGEGDGDGEDIELFAGEDGPHKTGVFALACTGPAGTDVNLHYGNLAVVCNGFTFPIDPTEPGRTESESQPSGRSLTYDVYRDDMTIADCEGDADCNGLYWNLAFDLTDLDGLDCALAFSATATDGSGIFVDGLPAIEGSAYPYIDVDAVLTGAEATCQQNPINGDESAVQTAYHGELGLAPLPMCYTYDGNTAVATNATGCDEVPDAGPPGNYLRSYGAPCNGPLVYEGYWVEEPVECDVGSTCTPTGVYGYGQCTPNTIETCEESCGLAEVYVSFTRGTTGTQITIPAGTYVSSETDADPDPGTGYQYNFVLTEDVVFLDNTTAVQGHTVLVRPSGMDPLDAGNVNGGTLRVIGADGIADPLYTSITASNEGDAEGGGSDSICVRTYGAQYGLCVSRGTPQACDPENANVQCPSGSYCEQDWTIDGGHCKQLSPEGTRCSGSTANRGVQQCESGLTCTENPSLDQNGTFCQKPGEEGDYCDPMQETWLPFCGPDFYCRAESANYATCAARKAEGDVCVLNAQVNEPRRYYGNCAPGLVCETDWNTGNRHCVAAALLENGEPCWTEGEQSLRKCKGHCDIDIYNPFETTLNSDGVCAADVGEGAPCHADEPGDDDYNGYCRRGLYCNQANFGTQSEFGVCLPVDSIGGICDAGSEFPDLMCPGGQICGYEANSSAGFMTGQLGYCVDTGCGNHMVEAGTGTTNSMFHNPDGSFEFGSDHGLAVGDVIKVKFSGGFSTWQTRTVTGVTSATVITLDGTFPETQTWFEIVIGDLEMCDLGINNCDEVVNGQHVCQCSTLCTSW